jgi:hypothetical protein
MKKLITLIGLTFLLSTNAYADVTFINGGFEEGTFNGWTISASGGDAAVSFPGAGVTDYVVANPYWSTGNHIATIVTPGTDPQVGINRTYNGVSGRVGDERYWGGYPYQYSQISQQAPVTGTDPGHIYFAWAAVLEISGHAYTDTPYFRVNLTNNTLGTTIYDVQHYEADAGFWTTVGGWKYSTGNNPSYPGWYIEDIDLTGLASVGDQLTLDIIARDCIPTGHAMYVYVDGFGYTPPPPPGVPEPSTFLLLGAGLGGLALWRRRK